MEPDFSNPIFIKMSKSLDRAIDSAGEDLWPILDKMYSRGEVSGPTSCQVSARVFLCLTATFFAGALGPLHFKISDDDFKDIILLYTSLCLNDIAHIYEVEDSSTVIKVYEAMCESLGPRLKKCLEGAAKSKKEGDLELIGLAAAFAWPLSNNRHRYGNWRPFEQSTIMEIYKVIKVLVETVINDFFPKASIVNEFFRNPPQSKRSGCFSQCLLLGFFCAVVTTIFFNFYS